jgi:hypothetical protein
MPSRHYSRPYAFQMVQQKHRINNILNVCSEVNRLVHALAKCVLASQNLRSR